MRGVNGALFTMQLNKVRVSFDFNWVTTKRCANPYPFPSYAKYAYAHARGS